VKKDVTLPSPGSLITPERGTECAKLKDLRFVGSSPKAGRRIQDFASAVRPLTARRQALHGMTNFSTVQLFSSGNAVMRSFAAA
jgi:hypothetical protein